jgi:hypothetical protein
MYDRTLSITSGRLRQRSNRISSIEFQQIDMYILLYYSFFCLCSASATIGEIRPTTAAAIFKPCIIALSEPRVESKYKETIKTSEETVTTYHNRADFLKRDD